MKALIIAENRSTWWCWTRHLITTAKTTSDDVCQLLNSMLWHTLHPLANCSHSAQGFHSWKAVLLAPQRPSAAPQTVPGGDLSGREGRGRGVTWFDHTPGVLMVLKATALADADTVYRAGSVSN